MRWRARWNRELTGRLAFGFAAAWGGGCSQSEDACGDLYCLDLMPAQQAPGVGSAQGLDVRDERVWVIGDADTGIARAFEVNARGELADANAQIALTIGGEDQAPHPTGLSWQPSMPTYLGNTVAEQGTIFLLDWGAAEADGSLDRAIVNTVSDTAAHDGSRPELVWVEDRWLVASADYGNDQNELRLYDPDRLSSAASTNDPNVLIDRVPAPPFVQSLHYWQAKDVLILVQNRKAGVGWKLTFVDLAASIDAGALTVTDSLEPDVAGELEGLHFLDAERVVMVTSGQTDNVYLGTLTAR